MYKSVASAVNIPNDLPKKRKRKRRPTFYETGDEETVAELTSNDESDEIEEEREFRQNVFYVILDSVIVGLTTRYDSTKSISSLLSFLWQYLQLSEDQITQACAVFGNKYPNHVSQNELKEEVLHLRASKD